MLSETATLDGMAEPLTADELTTAITRVAELRGVERAREARRLQDVAKASLAALADEGVWQATRDEPHDDVARQLHVHPSNVARSVGNHLRRSTQGHGTRRPRVQPAE